MFIGATYVYNPTYVLMITKTKAHLGGCAKKAIILALSQGQQ